MSNEQLDTVAASSRQTSAVGRKKLSPGPGLAAREVAAHQLARIHDATVRLVAEHGYKALKVREIVGLAEVSTRAFYEHFSSKEDCFLHTYRLINRRATRRIIAAQSGEPDWRKRSLLVFEEFIRSLKVEPASARLALIEAYSAGKEFLEETQRTEQVFEGMLIESLARAPSGLMVPSLIVEGVIAGIVAVARDRLLTGEIGDLSDNGGELVDWALSYLSPVMNQLESLDGQVAFHRSPLRWKAQTSSGDRALILKSAARLALTTGYEDLTVSRICSVAGVSRRKFSAHFDGPEHCYLTALEQRAGEAMAETARIQASARSGPGGVYRAIVTLTDCVTQDPLLTKVCLTDDFPRTRTGLRTKEKMVEAVLELCVGNVPSSNVSGLVQKAISGATWSLFQRYVLLPGRPMPITASLAYLYLAPVIGPETAVHAIQREQLP